MEVPQSDAELRTRCKKHVRRNSREGAKPHAVPTKGHAYLQNNGSREPWDGLPDCCCHFAHHDVELGGHVQKGTRVVAPKEV